MGSFHLRPERGVPALDFAEEEGKVQRAESQVDQGRAGIPMPISGSKYHPPHHHCIPDGQHQGVVNRQSD